MKTLRSWLLGILVMVMIVPACAPMEADCASEEFFCVGLVTDIGKVNDRSFNQSAWEGVQQSAKELGAITNYIETADAKDRSKNIAVFGDEGYDVIVTVGFDLHDETVEAAELYPNTDFIGVDQYQTEIVDRVAGLNFPEDQAGFLVGALAAMMSQTHKVGSVCGPDTYPAVWRFGEGYKAGAAYADELEGTMTDVLQVYHPDEHDAFIDPEWGAEMANSIIDQGADVIFGCGSVTGNGAIVAAAQAGAYVIGVDSDQYWTLPDAAPRMLSSAMKLIGPSVFDLIKLSKSGAFPSGNYFGHVSYAPFHDLESDVPADVKEQMDAIEAGLLDGTIQTDVPSTKPD